DIRLTPMAHKLGLVSDERLERVNAKIKNSDDIVDYLKNNSIGTAEMNPVLEEKGSSPISQKSRLFGILSRPQVEIEDLIKADKDFADYIANFDRSEEHTSELQSRENL